MTNIKNIINSLVLAGVLTCTPMFVCFSQSTVPSETANKSQSTSEQKAAQKEQSSSSTQKSEAEPVDPLKAEREAITNAEKDVEQKAAAMSTAADNRAKEVQNVRNEYDTKIEAAKNAPCASEETREACQARKAVEVSKLEKDKEAKASEKHKKLSEVVERAKRELDEAKEGQAAKQKAYNDKYKDLKTEAEKTLKKQEEANKQAEKQAEKQAASDLKKAENTYNENIKLIEKCKKNPKAKGCNEVENAKTAVAYYEEKNPQSEAVKEQENKVKEQELKEYNKAKSTVNAAQKEIDKFCGGDGKKDAAKCEAAQAKMAEALKTTNAYEDKKRLEEVQADINAQLEADIAAMEEETDAAVQKEIDKEFNDTVARFKKDNVKLKNDMAAQTQKYKNEAKEKEAKAKQGYDKKAQDLQDAQRKCASGDQSSCDEIEDLRAELEKAKGAYAKAHEHAQKMGVGEEKIKSPTEFAQDDYYIAQQDVNEKSEALAAAERTLKEKQAALAEAKAACEHSSQLNSKQGKEEAQKYCDQAEDLEKEVDEALQDVYTKQVELEDAQMILTDARKEAFPHENQDYLGFSVNNNDEMYNKGKKDVFKVITRRAAFILYHLKPVIYMLAGFGLIGFAFAAIFNKISWKWFGNLAIGLFLVANTGRLVEYMVFPSKGGADYMELEGVGVLNSFGDNITLSQALGDAQYAWVDNTYYVPNYSPSIENNAPNTDGLPTTPSEEENKKNTRGFCEAENEGGGLFGGGAFTSCVKDIISAGKKAADTVKQAQSTVDAVKNTVNQVVNAAENIGDAAVGMVQNLKEGDLAGAFDEIAVMGENANNIFASTGSMINYANDTTLNVSNNIQDMGLSRDEVAELELRRAAGEATNSVGALLKGQTLDEDGRAERTYTGEIASNKDKNRDSGQSEFMDVVDEVVSGANTTRNTVVDAANTGADFAGAVQNFSVPNKMTKGRLHGKTPTINDAINKNRNQEGAQP